MSKGEAQKAVPVISHALIRLLCDLGVSSDSSFEPYHPRVRDRGDVRAMRCSQSGVIVLDRIDHIDISHYDARDEHATTIMLPGAETAIEVTLPPLRPNDDDRRRAARHGNAVAERDWVDVGTGAGGILPLLAPMARSTVVVEPSGGCREALGKQGYSCFVRIGELAPSSFDTATAFHVVEHFIDPLADLQAMRRCLRPGGTLIVEVPHARDFLLEELDSLAFRDFTLWSEHLLLHTRESLERLLRAAGFKDIVVTGVQRYPLANHLHWLARARPGGHQHWRWLDSPELAAAYESALARNDRTDTLIAHARA